jgi:hypothetical protein
VTDRRDVSRDRFREALAQDRYASVALVAANLVPLALVLADKWSTVDVLLVYWAENLVIGGYSVPRILFAGQSGWGDRIGGTFFFTLHYGLFCSAHGGILVEVFKIAEMPKVSLPLGDELLRIAGALPDGLWLAVALLAVSHGVSFVRYYLLGGERAAAKSDHEMFRPYGRIVVMHLAVLGGAFFVQMLGAPIGALLLLILLKTAFDLALHLRSHAGARQRGSG